MEDKLRLNTRLFGFDGIIGRRDYFLNQIIIASMTLFFILPYQIWLFSHIQAFSDLFEPYKMFEQASILLKLWFLIGTIGTFVLSASNISRRLNDINGKINSYLNIFIITLFFLFSLSPMLPLFFSYISIFIGVILGLVILFKKGKITSNYPYDFTKEFNWAAFIGTWIWGLFNKSYKTLWMLLIWLTPWVTYYAIYCGLKGNEWAYKNKKCSDVEIFNKSQKKQTKIFAILFFLIMPIIYFVIIFIIILSLAFMSADNVENNSKNPKETISKIENVMSKFGSIYFDSHIITTNENKYYLKSADWNNYSFQEKKDIIDLAANLSKIEREKEYEKQNPNGYKSFSKTTELLRTKIYSSETKNLLGEFYVDKAIIDRGSFKEIFKASMDAYKFYND